MPKTLSSPIAATIGALIFFALSVSVSTVVNAMGFEGFATRQIALKLAMVIVSLVLMALIGRDRRTWGFVAPREWFLSTMLPICGAGMLGALATATILGLGLPPLAGLSELSVPTLVLVIWFGSTIAEEIFVRGLIQGWMQPLTAGEHGGRVLASGILFGAMHLGLFAGDTDARTAVTIVVATTLLGLICAWSRERSGSLVGPLTAHFAFNACGVFGGIGVMVVKAMLGA